MSLFGMVVPIGTAILTASPSFITKLALRERNGLRNIPVFALGGVVTATTSHGVSAEALAQGPNFELQLHKLA